MVLKPQKIVTPIGTSHWCALNPESPDTKFGSKWYVDLIVPKKSMKDFMEQAKSFLEQARSEFGKKKKVNPLPVKPHLDEDGNETDSVIIKCKLIAEGQKKDGGTYTNKLRLIDCDKKPFFPTDTIGMGTKMRVALNMSPYDVQGVGVTFKISTVQIIDVNYYEGSADVDEFDIEEGNTSTEDDMSVKSNDLNVDAVSNTSEEEEVTFNF